MRRLFPTPTGPSSPPAATAPPPGESPRPPDGPDSLDDLADAYAYPATTGAGRPWLRANMVASLDGAAHHQGRSEPLSCAADMRLFGVLRALADVIIVGAETVRREGYGPARARKAFAARRAALGQSPAPVMAVVSASLDLDFTGPLFTRPVVPTILLTGARAPADRLLAARQHAEVVLAGEGTTADAAQVVRALVDRGHTRLLTEGGPRLLAQFASADVLDELCLSVSPLIASGDSARITNGPDIAEPHRFTLSGLLEDDGYLFTRYVRAGRR
ncbi:diaminohydroxyphosphoribosylaminopyrimidine reductase [Wenjunlia vitaminophila]|uniref:Diaminohydroxyphosphoribosylaminopyrimidine reductase n=1 Tax=Wenjunlia vitaminophila TaxID=76728 RepID=A0A0T6LZC2_WENVI|nr:pyrimidine reductase family protein [Wenjunlia vitaminophila]KRV51365.1 diaminohydroxyphosphoribosylaminopyrimidine reductase [Wenjunlia vitaminophila]